MKFGDVYKAANNKITKDKNELDEIFSKQEKKVSFFPYSTACAAAAVLIMVCSAGFFAHTPSKNTVPKTLYSGGYDVQKNDIGINPKSPRITKCEEFEQTVTPSQETYDNAQNIKTTIIPSDKTAPRSVTSDEYFDMPLPASESLQSDNYSVAFLTGEDYLNYLGITDLIESIDVPCELEFVLPEEIKITRNAEDGTVISDEVSFDCKYKGDIIANLIIGKENKPVLNYISEEKIGDMIVCFSDIDGKTYVLVTYNDVWLDIKAHNIDSKDLKALLNIVFVNKNSQ